MPDRVDDLPTEPMTALSEGALVATQSASVVSGDEPTPAAATRQLPGRDPAMAATDPAGSKSPSIDGASTDRASTKPDPSSTDPSFDPFATDRASVDTTGSRSAVAERIGTLVEREERAKFAQRTRRMIRVGVPAWLAFAPLDVLVVYWRDAPGWIFVLSRTVPALVGVLAYLYLRRHREPSMRSLRATEAVIFTTAMVALSSTASTLGGWGSPRLALGVLLIMSHGILLGRDWRGTLQPVLLMLFAMPATLGVASLLSPAVGAQLSTWTTIPEFLVVYSSVFGAGVISLVASNSVHRLRRQVAEAQSIGRYRLRRRIAKGGMGEVWSAFHAGLQRDVAVKLIQADLSTDEVAVERFEREVRTLAELTHPNTIRVFDYGATETGVLYYAMELLDAQDLEGVLRREGPFEPERAVRLVTQASQALAEAHQRGIVHRDIKPANLLLADAGKSGEYIKVIDFGIAKQADVVGLTQTGMVVGTPGFMAPETITGGTAGPTADVFALGMVLYVLLAGELPYSGATPMALVQATLDADAPPLERTDVPPAVVEVIERCLRRDPFARFADAGELAHALRDAM